MNTLQRMLPLNSEWLEWSSQVNSRHLAGSKVTLLAGEASKNVLTSLVFQAAVSVAAEGHQVAFVCRQPFSCLPVPVHGMQRPETSIMKNLKFIYLTEMAELVDYLAGIHQAAFLPNLIIVDGLQHYIQPVEDKGVSHTVARLCALLIDAAYFIAQKSTDFSQVLVSLEDAGHGVLPVCRKLVKSVYTIHKDHKELSDIRYQLKLPLASRHCQARERNALLFNIIMNSEAIKLKDIMLQEEVTNDVH